MSQTTGLTKVPLGSLEKGCSLLRMQDVDTPQMHTQVQFQGQDLGKWPASCTSAQYLTCQAVQFALQEAMLNMLMVTVELTPR